MSKTNLVLLIAIVIVLVCGGVFFLLTPKSDSSQSDREVYRATPPIPLTTSSTATTTESLTTTTPTTTPIVSSTPSSTSMTDTTTTTVTNELPRVRISTSKGDIVVELFQKDAPKTVENFLTLVGKEYYNGVIFHRVIKGFMIQGGDPTGTGSGGPGYTFADELNANTESYKRGYVRGTLAMANAGPNTNGSQFFIMHADYPLPNAYTIFGRVVEGLDVVDAIATTPTGRGDRPVEEVVMSTVVEVK
jgi:cyclophilin family peptidyl-prolyl cis-trans isomerase